jgi:hypothetical protein
VDGWKSFAATIDTWEWLWQVHKLYFGQEDVKETYALRDLVDITGAGRRTIQFWADHGVLWADKGTDHAGTGTHRRFSRDEAIIACIVQAFALRSIGIGELIQISHFLRSLMLDPSGETRKTINQAISDENSMIHLIFETWNDKGRARYSATLTPREGGVPRFKSLLKPDGFASIIRLRTYLSNMDE